MSQSIEISLVCCDESSDEKRSQVITTRLDQSVLEDRLISVAEQNLSADEAKDLHLAAHHQEHGRVTYLQHVKRGGFFVYVGDPSDLKEHWFGEGSWVGFNDDRGPGHASKVGPEGCQRTFRLLRGHLDVS